MRSFSEVFLHIADGNLTGAGRVGIQPPGNLIPIARSASSFHTFTTDKDKVVDVLTRSFEAARKAADIPAGQYGNPGRWLDDRIVTWRFILLYTASHNHEHLGQLVAYSRVNGIVPPWSQ